MAHKFPESQIRKRLKDGYRHISPRHSRGIILVDDAIRDVRLCLMEIDELLQNVDYRVERITQHNYAETLRSFDPRVEGKTVPFGELVDEYRQLKREAKSRLDTGKTAPAADAPRLPPTLSRSSRNRRATPSR